MSNWMASVDSENLSSVRVQLLCFQESLLLPKWAFFFLFPISMPESASACNWTREKCVCIATGRAVQVYSSIFSKPPMHYLLCWQVKGVSLFAYITWLSFCLSEYFWSASILLDAKKQICCDSCLFSCWVVVKIYHVTSDSKSKAGFTSVFG